MIVRKRIASIAAILAISSLKSIVAIQRQAAQNRSLADSGDSAQMSTHFIRNNFNLFFERRKFDVGDTLLHPY